MKAAKRDGSLFLYSVPTRLSLERDKLEPIVKKYGLDHSLLPRETSGPDKFRKACKEVLSRGEWRSVEDKDGRQVKLSWTTVKNDKQTLQMDLMQQVIQGKVDKAGFMENPVEHSVFKMFFHKDVGMGGKDSITFQVPRDEDGNIDRSSWVEGVKYDQLIKDVIDQQEVYVNNVDGGLIAEMMKGYLKRLNARMYRRFRSVHYIPEQQLDHAERFQNAMREWSDSQIDVSMVPMFDTSDMKKFFEDGMLEELKDLYEEIQVDGQMQDRKFNRLDRQISEMEDIAKVYDGKIDRSKIETVLEVCRGQMMLAREANKRWKEELDAQRIRNKEEKKRVMKEKKEQTMADENRLSVL